MEAAMRRVVEQWWAMLLKPRAAPPRWPEVREAKSDTPDFEDTAPMAFHAPADSQAVWV